MLHSSDSIPIGQRCAPAYLKLRQNQYSVRLHFNSSLKVFFLEFFAATIPPKLNPRKRMSVLTVAVFRNVEPCARKGKGIRYFWFALYAPTSGTFLAASVLLVL